MPSLRNSVATEFPNPVVPQNLVKILSIGIDADDDKVIDRVEDAGPNGGGWQQRWYRRQCPGPCCISSHIRNSYITVEANPMQVLGSLDFEVCAVYRLAQAQKVLVMSQSGWMVI